MEVFIHLLGHRGRTGRGPLVDSAIAVHGRKTGACVNIPNIGKAVDLLQSSVLSLEKRPLSGQQQISTITCHYDLLDFRSTQIHVGKDKGVKIGSTAAVRNIAAIQRHGKMITVSACQLYSPIQTTDRSKGVLETLLRASSIDITILTQKQGKVIACIYLADPGLSRIPQLHLAILCLQDLVGILIVCGIPSTKLTILVAAPEPDASILVQRHSMIRAGGNCRIGRRHCISNEGDPNLTGDLAPTYGIGNSNNSSTGLFLIG